MNIRYFVIRYLTQLLLVAVAFLSACLLFGIFYAVACCTGKFASLFPMAIMFASVWLFWKKPSEPLPTIALAVFASYVACGLLIAFIPDANGSYLAGYFWCANAAFVSIAFRKGTDAIVSLLECSASNNHGSKISDTSQSAANRSNKKKETLLSDGLERLRTEPISESSGKLIIELIQRTPSKKLLVYVRIWLALYPDDKHAPKLVGHWIEKYDSNEAIYRSEYYLRTVADPQDLRILLLGIGASTRSPRKIYDLIETRLEREFHHDAWSYLQNHQGKANCKRAEKIILRWLELNRSNPDQDLIVSAVAMFTTSVDIVESALLWAETVGNSRGYYFVLTHLLHGDTAAHARLKPRIAAFSRSWVAAHPDDENCGQVHGALAAVLQDPDDMRAAKEWFIEHKGNDSARWALIGLLRASSALKRKADPYIVEETKILLRSEASKDRTPVMVGALLNAHLDDEIILFAKQKCAEPGIVGWLLGRLLRLAPDEETIARAKEVLTGRPDPQLEHDLLLTLLNLSPSDTALRKDARRWIKRHCQRFPDTELRELLDTRR